MTRRRTTSPEPPLLAYIAQATKVEGHARRRADAEAAIGRLYVEQAALIEADKAAPEEIGAAAAVAADAAEVVATLGAELAQAMEDGAEQPGQRQALADAQSHMVEARSRLDRLTRQAAERTRRLTAMADDIEAWEATREKASRALMLARQRDGNRGRVP